MQKGLSSNPASCSCPSKQNFVLSTCGMLAQHSEIQVQHLCKAAPSVESRCDQCHASLHSRRWRPFGFKPGFKLDMASCCGSNANAETCEISWNHRLSQCKYWTVQTFFLHSLNFLKLPFFSFSLPYANIANPGSRYLLLQTLQSLPALVTTFSTMECFLLLRCFTDLGHRPPCFGQNLLHLLAQKAAKTKENQNKRVRSIKTPQKMHQILPLRLFNVSNPTGQLGVLTEAVVRSKVKQDQKYQKDQR